MKRIRVTGFVMLFIMLTTFALSVDTYYALGSYFSTSYASLFEIDSNGDISIKQNVSTHSDSEKVEITRRGNYGFIGEFCDVVSAYSIDKNCAIQRKNDLLDGYTTVSNCSCAITEDDNFVVLANGNRGMCYLAIPR